VQAELAAPGRERANVVTAEQTPDATSLRETGDEPLACAARAGSQLAFAELYRRYAPVFAGYARRRLEHGASDVVQVAFIAVFTGLPGYRGPRFFPWAYRICVNAVTDELRRRRRRPEVVTDKLRDDRSLAGQVSTPEQELIAKRLSERLRDALAGLPDGQRAVFVLARVDGLSYAEIAELLDVPEGTVKSRMFKAVKKLFPKGDDR
jgi:RNA polymerase sigma-70 factor (ECF subfamily)